MTPMLSPAETSVIVWALVMRYAVPILITVLLCSLSCFLITRHVIRKELARARGGGAQVGPGAKKDAS